jgi:hypothetical protein
MITDAHAAPLLLSADAHRRRWLPAVVMVGAAMMDLIDLTVARVADPRLPAPRPHGPRGSDRV